MFAGGERTSSATWIVKEDFKLRPYNAALNDLTNGLCKELGQEGSDNCLFETRTAFDCLLRHRVRKNGDITDNIGACKNHINNMKSQVSRSDHSNRFLDAKLRELDDMRKSFV